MPRKRGRKSRSTWGSNDDAGAGRRRLRYWADLHDGKGYTRRSMTIVGTRRDGDEMLARLRVEHSKDRPTPTVGEVYERWWLPELVDRHESGELSRSALVNYRSRWNRHVAPRWAGVQVTDVRALDVQSWLMGGMTAEMAKASLRVLRSVLDMAVRYEVTDHNPAAARYRMPRGTVRTHSKDVYTAAEMIAALDAVRGTVAYVPAVLCGVASCRPGESLGVLRSELMAAEVGGMTLAVADLARQVDRDGHVVEGLKTPQSARPVVVPEPWSLDLLAQPGPWLVGSGERPVSQTIVRAAWDDALAAAGISPIPFRNLRNSWRTYMRWELGVAEDMLESMMGHVGRNVGEQHYDRPAWEVYAAVVADAWMRWRDGQNAQS